MVPPLRWLVAKFGRELLRLAREAAAFRGEDKAALTAPNGGGATKPPLATPKPRALIIDGERRCRRSRARARRLLAVVVCDGKRRRRPCVVPSAPCCPRSAVVGEGTLTCRARCSLSFVKPL